jgi:hypothetical protein
MNLKTQNELDPEGSNLGGLGSINHTPLFLARGDFHCFMLIVPPLIHYYL